MISMVKVFTIKSKVKDINVNLKKLIELMKEEKKDE